MVMEFVIILLSPTVVWRLVWLAIMLACIAATLWGAGVLCWHVARRLRRRFCE